MTIDAKDRRILTATQAGLPLTARPFAVVGDWIGMDEAEVISRVEQMMSDGVIRRIGAATNHYALGMLANGMSVWDVDDARAEDLGRKVGALDFVTHCYLRPRALPDWSFNLFAMIHGPDRSVVEAHRAEIATILGSACRENDILYSTRILKKTGMRLSKEARPCSG